MATDAPALPRQLADNVGTALGTGGIVVVWAPASHCARALLVGAAAMASTATIAGMVRHGSGLVCVTISVRDCARLGIPAMPVVSTESCEDLRVAVDMTGSGTGISAYDRARTVRALADAEATPLTFTRPGHVLPVLVSPHRSWVDDRGTHVPPARLASDTVGIAGFSQAVYTHLVAPDGADPDFAYAARFAEENGSPLVIEEV